MTMVEMMMVIVVVVKLKSRRLQCNGYNDNGNGKLCNGKVFMMVMV